MRRLHLPLLPLLLTACAGSAPVSGARVLDRGQLEGLAGVDLGLTQSCTSDSCGGSLFLAPTLGLRAGLVDRWLDLGVRATPTNLQADLKLELFRTEHFAAAIDPSLQLVFSGTSGGYGPPRAWEQLLGVVEGSFTPWLALVLFGGPTARLARWQLPDEVIGVVGAGVELQLWEGLRLHPWWSVTVPPFGDVGSLPTTVVAVGLGVGFGDAVRPALWGGEAPAPTAPDGKQRW